MDRAVSEWTDGNELERAGRSGLVSPVADASTDFGARRRDDSGSMKAGVAVWESIWSEAVYVQAETMLLITFLFASLLTSEALSARPHSKSYLSKRAAELMNSVARSQTSARMMRSSGLAF
jgi:hypothetical protein